MSEMAQHCRAILLSNEVSCLSWQVAPLLTSRSTNFPNRNRLFTANYTDYTEGCMFETWFSCSLDDVAVLPASRLVTGQTERHDGQHQDDEECNDGEYVSPAHLALADVIVVSVVAADTSHVHMVPAGREYHAAQEYQDTCSDMQTRSRPPQSEFKITPILPFLSSLFLFVRSLPPIIRIHVMPANSREDSAAQEYQNTCIIRTSGLTDKIL